MKRIHLLKPGTFTDMNNQSVTFTTADLAAAAAAYDPALHEAPLVIGHPAHDMPAYGWLKGAAFDAEGLHGDPHQVDDSLVSLVGAGRVKKISTSLWPPNHPDNPKPGSYYIKHVGFLGAAAPAVKGLKSVQLAGKAEGLVTIELASGADGWTIGSLFRGLRDYLIGEKGQEVADRVLPDGMIASLQTAAAYQAGAESGSADPDCGPVMFAAWNADRRKQLNEGKIKGGFAGPDDSYPIASSEDVGNAWSLAGKAKDPDAVRKKIIELAKEHGWTDGLPDTAQAWAKDHSIELSEPSMTQQNTLNLAEQQAQLERDRASITARENALKQREDAGRRTEVVAFVGGLVKDAKVHPRHQNFLVELAMGLTAVKPLAFAEADGKTAEGVDALERFKTFLKELQPVVALGEHAKGNGPVVGGIVSFTSPDNTPVDRHGLEIHSKALAYQKQNPTVDYIAAVKAVS